MISKKRLCKKLDEIKYYIEQKQYARAVRAIETQKEMVNASQEKAIAKKILYLCMECTREGYRIGIHEQKGNRRVRLDEFAKKQRRELEKEISEML